MKLLILLTVFAVLACVVHAGGKFFRPELFFKKGQTYQIEGSESLAVVIEDPLREFVERSPKLAIKICKYVGASKYTCAPPMSIMSIGLPGTRKTLLFNGINVTIRLNNMMKSISMHGLFACDAEYCGQESRSGGDGNGGSITYIPTTKVLNEIIVVESAIVHRLNVASVNSGYGSWPLVLGPDSQAVYTYFNKNPSASSFYTLGDGSSVLQPTKTETLKPVGYTSGDDYSKPVFYDGTQFWLRCRCGGDYDVISSLDFDTKWTLGSDESRLDNGAAAANNVLWRKDDRNSAASFSLYDITTRTFLRKFMTFEHSQAAKSMDGHLFTLSLDGSILYLVDHDRRDNLISILGLSTTTGQEVHVSMHKLPASMHSELLGQSSDRRIEVCGGGMTAAGLAVCLIGTYSSSNPVTHFLPIFAV